MAKYKTKIELIIIILATMFLIYLGTWQLSRMSEKKDFISSIETNLNNPPIDFSLDKTNQLYSKVELSGHFVSGHDIFLYGRRSAYPEKDGYYLLSPFKANDGETYLVSRGWLPHSEKNAIVSLRDSSSSLRHSSSSLRHSRESGNPESLAPKANDEYNTGSRITVLASLSPVRDDVKNETRDDVILSPHLRHSRESGNPESLAPKANDEYDFLDPGSKGRDDTRHDDDIKITAIILRGEKKGFMVPENDLKNNVWFALDLKQAKEIGAITNDSFYLMQIQPTDLPKGVMPLTTTNLSKVRNDHMEYAVTWYSLAFALVVMYIYRKSKQSSIT